MPNRNYLRGRSREYYVIRKLREAGAVWVVRSYGSHGVVDITAVFPDRVRLIQVKKNYISPEERRGLREFASKFKTEKISVELWVSKNGRFIIERMNGGRRRRPRVEKAEPDTVPR